MALPNQSVQQPNRVKNMLGLRDVVQSSEAEPKRQLIEGARREMSPGAMGGSVPVPEQPVDTWEGGVGSLHEMLFTPSPELENDSLASLAVKPFVEKEIDKAKKERQMSLQDMGRNALGFNPEDEFKLSSTGGLIGMAAGGMFDGRVRGDGHGMEDNVFMPIRDGREQVGTLAVSPKEYVVDAHTMSALGNGNPDEGANVMDTVVENIREQAYGTERQPNEISGLAALRPMIERV
tara:strand:- start:456 stop:1160 length:705 start_codon:yes stop_codon:yes gene_type:complete